MSLPRSALRETWSWLPLGVCRWKSGGCRPEQADVNMDVNLLAGRLGLSVFSGDPPLPWCYLGSAPQAWGTKSPGQVLVGSLGWAPCQGRHGWCSCSPRRLLPTLRPCFH